MNILKRMVHMKDEMNGIDSPFTLLHKKNCLIFFKFISLEIDLMHENILNQFTIKLHLSSCFKWRAFDVSLGKKNIYETNLFKLCMYLAHTKNPILFDDYPHPEC